MSRQSVVARYLRGELSVDDAAEQIAALGGEPGLGLDSADPTLRANWDELMGRLLWITLRNHAREAAGERPFGAAEFRALQAQVREELERDGEDP